MERRTLGEWAQVYADRHGWAVFPLRPKMKEPATEHGFKDASRDPGMVAELWQGRAACNIGLATGAASGVWVLDVDGKRPGAEREGEDEGLTGPEAMAALEARWGALPETRRVRTSNGGWHAYFRMPAPDSGRRLRNRGKLRVEGRRSSLDVRATGGYVVLPPSVHPSGAVYEWDGSCREVAEAPDWLLDLVAPRPMERREVGPLPEVQGEGERRYGSAALRKALERLAGVSRETAHDAVYREAAALGELVAGGCLDAGEVEARLVEAAVACGRSEREAMRTVRDGMAKGAENPRRPEPREWTPRVVRRTEGAMPEAPPWEEPIPGERWADDDPGPVMVEVGEDGEGSVEMAALLSEPPEAVGFAAPAEPDRMTDLGNARVLVRLSGRDFRWCTAMPGTGWMRWDGSRWRADATRGIDRAAQGVSRWWRERGEVELEAAKELAHGASTDEEKEAAKEAMKEAKRVLGWALECESARRLGSMVKLAEADEAVVTEQAAWDARPELVCTPEATYNLRTMRQYPPRRGDLLTRRTAVSAEAGSCILWESFVYRIMGRDLEMMQFLQRCMGYSLLGNPDQVMFIAYGATGANGKSTLIDVMREILGDYLVTARVETFLDKPAGGIPNDLAALAGARVVTCSEPKEGAELDVALVKLVTGGDPVTARFLNREFFSFRPSFALWYIANHKPVVRDAGYAIWRRLMLIPFEVTIPEEERDPDLAVKLRREAPTILRWVLDGLKAYREVGLSPPERVRAANAAYREESDIIGLFLDECVVKTSELEGASVTTGDVYAVFREWCADQGIQKPPTQITLSRKLADRGWRQVANRHEGRRWADMKLKRQPRSRADSGAGMWPRRAAEA